MYQLTDRLGPFDVLHVQIERSNPTRGYMLVAEQKRATICIAVARNMGQKHATPDLPVIHASQRLKHDFEAYRP